MVRKTFANLCIDLGKLMFGSLILGAILKGDFGPYQILIFGIAGSAILFTIGIILIAITKE